MFLFFFILMLLVYGTYTDIKERRVKNKISILIAVLSIPYIIMNSSNLALLHLILVSVIIVMMFSRVWGAADGKVMIPLTLTMTPVGVTVFYAVFVVMMWMLLLKYKNNIPLFVAISTGYIVSSAAFYNPHYYYSLFL